MKKLVILFLLWAAGFVHAAPPQRIVSIAPSFTEILYALGLDKEIVGTSNYCDYPEQARHTQKVGDILNPNIEKIISLHPDAVFCGAWKWQLPDTLRKMGITVVEIHDATNLDDVFNNVILIGKKIEREKQAEAIVVTMKTRLAKMRSESGRSAIRPKVYVELDAGNWTAGGGSYMSEILEVAGLQNIFSDRKEPYMMVTLESIAAHDPDLIISLTRRKDEFGSASWHAFRAVKEQRIIGKDAIDWNSVVRQSPRLVDGVSKLRTLVQQTMSSRSQ